VRAAALPADAVARLAAAGVRCGPIDPRTLRFVTHHDVDDAGIDHTVTALDQLG
jgi:hypothetical protein